MVPSHIRVAAGFCVLAVGVLIAAPAVAVADPDPGGAVATSGDESGIQSEQDATTSSASVDSVAEAERNAAEGVTSTFGSGREPGDPALTSADSSTEEPAVTASADDNDSAVVAADSDPVTSSSDPGTSDSGPITESSDVVAPPTVEAEPVATEMAPVSEEAAPVPTEVAPVTDATAPVTDATAPVSYVAPLGASLVTPISDVIAAMQYLLTAVVVPLVQLQYDLASLFALTGVEPVVDSLGRVGGGLSPAAGASLGSDFSLATPVASLPNVTSVAEAHRLTPLGAIAAATMGEGASQVAGASSQPVTTPSVPSNSISADVQSFLRDVGREILRSPSLMALAAVALPGVVGLLIITAAGVGFGYRQAKAGFALCTEGIARFAGPARPFGVVRSGSLVVVRPRALRSIRPPAFNAGGLLDEVA